MSPEPARTHDVILHVRVPGIYADDLLGLSNEFDGCPIIDVISEELRLEVGIVTVTEAGEVAAHEGTIVSADVVERGDVWSKHRLPVRASGVEG